jgi:hypothetical protein
VWSPEPRCTAEGATTRRLRTGCPTTAAAAPGRGAAFSLFLVGPAVPELAQVVPAVGRGVRGALAPWKAPESMINFLGDVTGPQEVAAAYLPATVERLREVKRTVDPAGIFSFGHAI